MARRCMAGLTASALAVLAALNHVPAAAAELRETSCAGSPFSFSASGYQVICEWSKEMIHAEGETGSLQIDVITITSDDPPMFLTVVSQVVVAPHLYIERRSLRESMRKFFEGGTVEAWNGVGTRNGYDTAEFLSEISGLPSRCVAIQRYTNPAWLGHKRHIVGMGCSIDSVEPVYAALARLQAPGD